MNDNAENTEVGCDGTVDIRNDDMVIAECEARLLAALVAAVQPRSIAEIGCGHGRSLTALMAGADRSDRLTGRQTLLWSCDTNPGAVTECKTKFEDLRPTIVHGDVHALLAQIPVVPDFAFIDGDHSLEGVTRDFQAVNETMQSGGLVVFHDSSSADAVSQFCSAIGALRLPTCRGMALWRKP